MTSRLDWRATRVIGHRGACGYAPENTIASLEKAAELGVGWVEFDAKLTADGVPIVFHDDTLERTTDGHGAIAEHEFDAIRELDAGAWFAAEFAGQRVPSLAETIDVLERLSLGAFVELKPCPGREAETGRVVARLLAERRARCALSSFRPESLVAARDAAPDISRALLIDELHENWRTGLTELGCAALHVGDHVMTREFAGEVKVFGSWLAVYTVDDLERASDLYSWGVDALFADCPDRLQSLP